MVTSLAFAKGEHANQKIDENGKFASQVSVACVGGMKKATHYFSEGIGKEKVDLESAFEALDRINLPVSAGARNAMENILVCETEISDESDCSLGDGRDNKRAALFGRYGYFGKDLLCLDSEKFYGPANNNNGRASTIVRELMASLLYQHIGAVRDDVMRFQNIFDGMFYNYLEGTAGDSIPRDINDQFEISGLAVQNPFKIMACQQDADWCIARFDQVIERNEAFEIYSAYGLSESLNYRVNYFQKLNEFMCHEIGEALCKDSLKGLFNTVFDLFEVGRVEEAKGLYRKIDSIYSLTPAVAKLTLAHALDKRAVNAGNFEFYKEMLVYLKNKKIVGNSLLSRHYEAFEYVSLERFYYLQKVYDGNLKLFSLKQNELSHPNEPEAILAIKDALLTDPNIFSKMIELKIPFMTRNENLWDKALGSLKIPEDKVETVSTNLVMAIKNKMLPRHSFIYDHLKDIEFTNKKVKEKTLKYYGSSRYSVDKKKTFL